MIEFAKSDSFESVPLVRIHIKNKISSDIVSRLMKWQLENKVYSERGGYSAPNGCLQFYLPEDAEKVVEWLKEQGIKERK
jgi:hypothetical protein